MSNKFEGFEKEGSLERAETFRKLIKKTHQINIKKKSRKGDIIKYRRFFYKFMVEVCEEKITRTGSYLGQNHATVLHALSKLNKILAKKLSEREEYETLKASVLGVFHSHEVISDEKQKYIEELSNKLKGNNSLITNYQIKLLQLEKSLNDSNRKISKLLIEKSELKKEVSYLNREMKSIYSDYKKHKGIEI